MDRAYEVPLPWDVTGDCPPHYTPDECFEYARLVADLSHGQMVPSQAPGTWALRCAACGTVETGLGFIEAHALAGLRTHLTPCCPSPDRRAEPTVYVRRESESCPRCGLSVEHVHTCRWP